MNTGDDNGKLENLEDNTDENLEIVLPDSTDENLEIVLADSTDENVLPDNKEENTDVDADADIDTDVNEDAEISADADSTELKSKKIKKDFKRNFKRRNSKKNRVITYIRRTLITLLLTIVILLAGIYSVMCMLVYGPSPTAKDLFVLSVKETSAMGFLANWFFSDDQIKEIMDKNSIKDTDEVTDTSLVKVSTSQDVSSTNTETPAIQIVDIKGATYKGKLMIVKDPSTVYVGTIPKFCEGDGLVVSDIAKNYNAIGGINGGEFIDGTTTYTGMPVGLVITKGKIVNGDENTVCHITGFTKDNILVVGNMTGKQALEKNIRDCISISNHIGPFLIINGTAQEIPDDGTNGGLNPRTAIGQRADGAVLLLVVDGRQANSLGATFDDLISIMQQYGAVNASAMDGGTSTQMCYQGEVLNVPYSPTGPRKCPTSFLVGGSN